MATALARPAARVLGMLASALLAVAAGAATAAPVFALAGDAVPAGQTLFITATANDLADLYGYQFTLNFDPSRVRLVTTQEGAFLGAGGATFFDGGTADNAAGTVGLVFDTLIGPGAGVSGSGDLARFEFTTLQAGPSAFSLSDALAVDSTLATIPVRTAGASVAIPEPATGAALSIGLLAMVGIRRRSGRSAALHAHP